MVHLSTAVGSKYSDRTWVNIQSARWVNIQSARTADGLLDGFGLDSTGAKSQLSFGMTPLSVDVYRFGIGTAIVQMAGHANNKTGLTGAQVLSFAQSYIASTDGIFNGVAPTAFAASTTGIVSPATNVWVSRTLTVVPGASSPFGISKMELLVDGTVVSTAATIPASFLVNTVPYAEGAHTISVKTTDLGGFVQTASIASKFDNTSPTATSVMPYTWVAPYMYAQGSISDLSGAYSVHSLTTGRIVYLAAGVTTYSILMNPGDPYGDVLEFRDNAGNCSRYNGRGAGNNGTWTLLATGFTC